ncbi:MAG: PAS domain S-box protein, partial [Nitrospinae bacterium]|nr:PAS domain S-box protein [Nitrospinota bacterium]
MLRPLTKARDELEIRVRERTAELEKSNERLQTEAIEHKQAKDKLRDSEARYRSLFEQSPYGILIVDPETAMPVDFNDVTHNQLGYSREEFARLGVSDYEAKEKHEETRVHIEKVLREGRDTFESLHRTKSGEI